MQDINEKELSRRDFFGLIGHTSIGTSIAGSAVITENGGEIMSH